MISFQNAFRRRSRRAAAGAAFILAAVLLTFAPAYASVLILTPDAPQPGDVLTLTVYPEQGETIRAVRMSAFDTPVVKFYPRSDGSQRAFLGFPFDRSEGRYALKCEVDVQKGADSLIQTDTAAFEAQGRDFPTQYITMKPSVAGRMSNHAAFRREKAEVQRTMAHSHPSPLWHGAWLVPASGHSTSSYGRRRFVNGRPWGQHNGADIRAAAGTPVRASNSGTVVLSEYLPTLRGNCVIIDHGCNVFSVYMHLSRRLVQAGTVVRRGQVIGRVGATGFVTGPHLHWEIRIGWEPVDPFRVVSRGLDFGERSPV